MRERERLRENVCKREREIMLCCVVECVTTLGLLGSYKKITPREESIFVCIG